MQEFQCKICGNMGSSEYDGYCWDQVCERCDRRGTMRQPLFENGMCCGINIIDAIIALVIIAIIITAVIKHGA